jgi:hypothetical protein
MKTVLSSYESYFVKAYVTAELLYKDRNFAKSHEVNPSGKFSPYCIELRAAQQHGSHVFSSFWSCEVVD